MKKASFLSVLTLVVSFAGLAAAQDPPPYTPPPGPPMPSANAGFGAPGQLVISDDITLAFIHQSQSDGGGSGNVLQFQPAIDFFVIPNLSIGGQLSVTYSSVESGGLSASTTQVGILPRVGYNIPLAPTVSLWPRLALGYVHASTDTGGGGASLSGYTVTMEVFAPVLFHPVPHFFVGVGPIFTTDLISKVEDTDAQKTTNIGLLSTIGGYIGGT